MSSEIHTGEASCQFSFLTGKVCIVCPLKHHENIHTDTRIHIYVLVRHVYTRVMIKRSTIGRKVINKE